MSKRDSGYERVKRDLYETPRWVIDALAEVLPLKGKTIWEPACGSGKMAEAIKLQGGKVRATDLHRYRYRGLLQEFDFVNGGNPFTVRVDGIITNPPYGERGKLAEAFIAAGLRRIQGGGFLALLLPADFDHAKSRARFFAECPYFSGRIVLTKRIKWFDRPTASGKKHGPKDNHCWFIWYSRSINGRRAPGHLIGAPRVWYAPRQVVAQDLAPTARGEAA